MPTGKPSFFRGRIEGRLLEATQVFYTVIYRFDGLTYHPMPIRGEYLIQDDDRRGSFGEDAMRQLAVWQKL